MPLPGGALGAHPSDQPAPRSSGQPVPRSLRQPLIQPLVQHGHAIRFDWGLPGARALIDQVRACVVVDVLSFSTTLSVAADAGIVVRPAHLADGRDQAGQDPLASEVVPAVSRDAAEGDPEALTLSPASFRRAARWARRALLPSPNGSAISAELAAALSSGQTSTTASSQASRQAARQVAGQVLAGCLRNRSAVAEHLAGIVRDGGAVAVIAAGESWPDGALRPGVEDLLGAGAILNTLAELVGAHHLSVEAAAAAAVARELGTAGLPEVLEACASGRELIGRGAAEDVRIAGETDTSSLVPQLLDGEYFPRCGRVLIRPAEAGDAAAVAQVFLSAWDHGLAGVRRAHDDDDVRGWVREILLPGGGTWVAVTSDETADQGPHGVPGEVVGMLTTHDGWVEQLYVAPAVEGTGVGQVLLGIARTRNPDGLQLWTFQCNARARAFYERHGFEAVEFTDGAANEEREPDVRYVLEAGG